MTFEDIENLKLGDVIVLAEEIKSDYGFFANKNKKLVVSYIGRFTSVRVDLKFEGTNFIFVIMNKNKIISPPRCYVIVKSTSLEKINKIRRLKLDSIRNVVEK